ncbi:MAG: hypothetical protein AAF530_20015 [Pseudomonadota bacterium]
MPLSSLIIQPYDEQRTLRGFPDTAVKGGGDPEERKRLHIHMNGSTLARLEAIRDYSEAPSVSAVIRHALQVYDLMISAERDGKKIVIEEPDGTKSRVVLVI